MVDRIRKIAQHYNLSPTGLADQIGVSRPVISHIFSERNKPSLEVVQKIAEAFSEVSLKWLLFGKGEMLKPLANFEQDLSRVARQPEAEVKIPEKLVANEKSPEKDNISAPEVSKFSKSDPEKKIIRIVFFYADRTFEEFRTSES